MLLKKYAHMQFALCYVLLWCSVGFTLRWRHNGRDSVSNHQSYRACLLNRLFRRRWKKTSKLRVTGLCVGNSPVTGEFPAQMASNAENVSISWRHQDPYPPWLLPCHWWSSRVHSLIISVSMSTRRIYLVLTTECLLWSSRRILNIFRSECSALQPKRMP